MPDYTANVDGLGTLRILEAIRATNSEAKIKFYQASTSELYGLVQETPQSETTPSILAVRMESQNFMLFGSQKLREAYGIFAAMVYCSTTRAQGEAKHLSLAKLLGP